MKFHYLARGIIFMNGKVLLAHMIGADHTFLPGGHIETGEKAASALAREIQEELGVEAVVKGFVGAVECAWSENGQSNHEIDLLFEVEVPGLSPDNPPRSKESHLEFSWAAPGELKARNLLPVPIRECLEQGQPAWHAYWGSSFEE